MRRHLAGALLVPLLAASSALAEYRLVWSDEFDGSSLDLTKWEPQIGTGCPTLCGWGNNELQYYRAENATVSGGFLTITARQESFGGRSYTSARLRTKDRGDWTYGRFEMRARMPIGQGIWPAFWMLPTDEVYGGWAASGEIDIMEYLGHQPNRVLGTIHYGGPYPANTYSTSSFTLPAGTFHDDFHVFALEWEEGAIRWYVDDVLYATRTSWWSTNGPYPAPFDQRFHLLLNMAVGGNLPGPPDGTTAFPQELVVDWVRVYQESDATGAPPVRNRRGDALLPNVPNPFGQGTDIRFELARAGPVELRIYDVTGRQVRELVHERRPAGLNRAAWDGRDEGGRPLAAGIYFCSLRTESHRSMRKMTLLR